MADETTTDTTPTTPDAPDVETPATDVETPPDLGDAGKKALDRMKAERDEARKQARLNADAGKRLKEIEDANKSDADKLTERVAAAEAERDALKAEAIRSRVALTKGIPADLVDRLRGTSEEEMSADADRLLAVIASASKAPAPRGAVDQGEREHKGGVGQLSREDVSQLMAAGKHSEIEAARKAGRLERLMSGK